MINNFSKLIIGIVFYIVIGRIQAQKLEFYSDFTITSSYIWRGIRQFEGSTLQGSVTARYDKFSIGMWYSGVNFNDGTLMETDPFARLNLLSGHFSSSIGITYYSYDFKKWNEDANGEVELFVSLNYGTLTFSTFFVPRQASTRRDPCRSNHWVELSGSITKYGIQWGSELAYGTYSSRYLQNSSEKAIGNLKISATKSLTETISAFWNYEIPIDSELDKSYWIAMSLSF